MDALRKFCQAFGLHPLVGFGMFAVDWMLFAPEAGTAGVAIAITVPIGLALTIPSVLLQKYAFHDDWGAALGKGMMIGILTAIPTALPSVLSFGAGALGMGKLLLKERSGP